MDNNERAQRHGSTAPEGGQEQELLDRHIMNETPGQSNDERSQIDPRALILRQTLNHVQDLGMRSTRHLDDTYYAILERASSLRGSVTKLQSLFSETTNLRHRLDEDATAFERDVDVRYENDTEELKAYKTTVEELVARLDRAKEKIKRLDGSVDAARNKVAKYERMEEDKKGRRRWWRRCIVWGFVAVLVLWIAVSAMLQGRRTSQDEHDVLKMLDEL
ncbi:hypothetical protein K470DRAFT_257195 [Piedraia hortae CBS 480.64]|uniref:Uncharacterized protein n=1 Tax=Piedraia hortae CBS 480.64 TaxID=1314780 RepID=A0A6A7C3I1_9PEZI|nr:hypothetical protein K470DRAFT_257195 [Piedraia hortae CBS 480.64]